MDVLFCRDAHCASVSDNAFNYALTYGIFSKIVLAVKDIFYIAICSELCYYIR